MKFNLQDLSDELSLSEIKYLLVYKYQRHYGDEKFDKMKKNFSITCSEMLDHLKEFKEREAFNPDKRLENIQSLLEINKVKKLKRSYLKFDYDAVRILKELGFLESENEDDGYWEEVLIATDKLSDFLKKFVDDEERYDFYVVNKALIKLALGEELEEDDYYDY